VNKPQFKSRGYFGIGIYNAKFAGNLGTLWRSAHTLGAAYIFNIGERYKKQKSDVSVAFRHIPFFEYKDFEEFKTSVPRESTLVAIENVKPKYRLETYCHPERAIYLLGAEDVGLPPEVLNECKHTVVLPGEFCLNVATTGSIVMYDRLVKNGR